ncbi:MAG: transcriptional regulator [Acidobacteriaceae bacterium]
MQRICCSIQTAILCLVVLFSITSHACAQGWSAVGPYGGDARSFAYNPSAPSHILLGTTNSWVYETKNGREWTRLSKIAASDSLVVDQIHFDEAAPKRVVVGAWKLNGNAGGIFISDDAGHHWKDVPDMRDQSVRALAQAPSDPEVWVAGTLSGVYRSQDGGLHWSLISPVRSSEIHEVESIAIDPLHSQIIYAGTWHLPWKTIDGGRTWQSIKRGLIVDSDVFSIIIDPHQPETVYASACSGIYKSLNGGKEFRKIQGIPSSARRTRALKQDPNNPNVIYAGTTEGLYRTSNAGTTWTLMTARDIIVNDVYVDPTNSQRVLMATDRSGVLESLDGGVSFHSSNRGFSQRQVSSLVVDPKNPDIMYAGVLNDKRFGGVFVSRDAGQTWTQISTGLDDDDVYSLAMSPQGTLLAGTNHGIYRWDNPTWKNVGHRLKGVARKVAYTAKKRHYVSAEMVYVPSGQITGSVFGLVYSDREWYAATADGVYSSSNDGFVWQSSPPSSTSTSMPFWNIAAHRSTVLVNGPHVLYLSRDRAHSWQSIPLPPKWDQAGYVSMDDFGHIWLGGRLGVASSENQGRSWQISRVPINNISGLSYDPDSRRIIVTSYASALIFGIDPARQTWIWWNPGWRTHIVRSFRNRMVAATLLHGILVQPEQSAAKHGM